MGDAALEVIVQTPGMSEAERDEFLQQFDSYKKSETTLVGFAVMGGIFGEGIDLVGDRLTGAVVVGVGLPAICLERELIREYFVNPEQGGRGFEYAYIYPGINRVLQAAGRVIRSEEDRGVILLVDERFSWQQYNSLFPKEWQPFRVLDEQHLTQALDQFWHP
jgi:DNA excision repair protein ERCC-2